RALLIPPHFPARRSSDRRTGAAPTMAESPTAVVGTWAAGGAGAAGAGAPAPAPGSGAGPGAVVGGVVVEGVAGSPTMATEVGSDTAGPVAVRTSWAIVPPAVTASSPPAANAGRARGRSTSTRWTCRPAARA